MKLCAYRYLLQQTQQRNLVRYDQFTYCCHMEKSYWCCEAPQLTNDYVDARVANPQLHSLVVDGDFENWDQPCYRDFRADLDQAAPGFGWYDLLTVALFDGKIQTGIWYICLTTCWSIVISSMKNKIAPGQYMRAVFYHGDEITRCKGVRKRKFDGWYMPSGCKDQLG